MFRIIGNFYNKAKSALGPSTAGWSGATWALWGTWVLLVGVIFATDMWGAFTSSRLIGFLAFIGTMAAIAFGIALALVVVGWIRKSYRVPLLLVAMPLFLFGVIVGGPGGGIMLAIYVILMVSFLFGPLNAWRKGSHGLARIYTLAVFLVGISMFGGLVYLLVTPIPPLNPALEDFSLEDRTLDLPDPGLEGQLAVETYTYGSGNDLHRREYGEGANWQTQSVDGSKLIDHWDGLIGWLRTGYWGFDATELPLQGRVWMPVGEGPFPLVLVVHGNHSMERFSDPGYDYLGEHLASRGYIVVSVDENFLNGSTANMIDPRYMGLGEENDARGWMLLEHLKAWAAWNANPDHQMFGKVDMERIGLMGHSRGGEAVAIAAAFNSLDRYPDDATVTFDYHFNIGAVIAIAPADGQYRPREGQTHLKDINYFVIHGAMDGDVSSFMGSSQYSRIHFSPESENLKASLYVARANHGQFNTSWGIYDTGLPYGWLLNTRDLLPTDEQEQIAKVYFTAFLSATLNGDRGYLPLFADARYGARWLPNNFYINNMKRGGVTELATFEEDMDPATGTASSVAINGTHLSKWRESFVSLKWGTLDTMTAIVAWDSEVIEEPASLTLEWDPKDIPSGAGSTLAFSAAALEESTKPNGWEPPEEVDETDVSEESEEPEDETPKPLDWSIIVTDESGQSATLLLSNDQPLYPQLKSQTSRLPAFSQNPTSEIVMRRFTLPLSLFAEANSALNLKTISSVSFVYDQSPAGVIALDDIVLEPASAMAIDEIHED